MKLIRIENLALIAIVQLIFRYGFLEQQPGLPLALNHWQYALLVIATLLIAAGGSLMESVSGSGRYSNAMSEGKAYNIYGLLNIVAIGIGYYLSQLIFKTEFIAAFVIAASMLYFAVTNFRQTLLVGNVLVSLACAMVIIVIGIYNFYPFMVLGLDKDYIRTMFDLLLDYSIFTFIIALIYTLVSDMENMDADYNSGKTTLPIVLGRERTAKIVFFFSLLPVALLLYYANTYLINLWYAVGYGLLFILGPMIYFLIKLWSAKSAKDFKHLGLIIKLVMLFTALSTAVITYNINYNA